MKTISAYHRTYVEIDLDCLANNLRVIRGILGEKPRLMSVLKANAYGHGAAMCVPVCEALADCYGVATVEEALELRENGATLPILVFGYVPGALLDLACEKHLTLSVFSPDYARELHRHFSPTGRSVPVHVKVDTGMNRTGFACRLGKIPQAAEEVSAVFGLSSLVVKGVYTHFPSADSATEEDIQFTRTQHRAFTQLLAALQGAGHDTGLAHCCSSSGLLSYPEYHMDMVRIGMMELGLVKNDDIARQYGLRPMVNWRAKVVALRELEAGESVSYGRVYRAPRPTRLAVVSLGYGDGYRRSLTGKVQVLLGGKRAPVVGKICMDCMMVDITGLERVTIGDDVTVLGEDGGDFLSTSYIASLTEGVNGEVTCGISPRVHRIYLRDGEVIQG